MCVWMSVCVDVCVSVCERVCVCAHECVWMCLCVCVRNRNVSTKVIMSFYTTTTTSILKIEVQLSYPGVKSAASKPYCLVRVV
jgi:hypothetical protein